MTKLRFFGRARDAAGRGEMVCELPVTIETVGDLRSWLLHHEPELGAVLEARDIRIAVDRKICMNEHTSVRGAAEIAFMPPMSGG